MKREIYDEDHESFRASVKEFLDRSVVPHVEQHAIDKALPREFWLEAGKQGFLGLEIPEAYGGAEAGDYRFNAVMAEELSKVNAALGSCWGIHADITAPYIVELCSEDQKQRWLPGVAAGETLLAIGMTEPSGGSDLAALKSTAVRDGDDWVVNGSKTFITNGYSADLVVTAVRTSPEKKAKGITLFAIPTDAPGFSRGRKLDKVGQDESDTAELFFENVRVTDDDIVGELDNGFIHMMQNLPQ
uniref:acyl-CoA dehydrogenase family protein n=1 Tax=Nocardioides sp. TaxID=35761 RepID=UPI00286A36DD